MNGQRSVLGRSVVIHSFTNTNAATNRIAQCVIGVMNEGTPLPLPGIYQPPQGGVVLTGKIFILI